jgi:hypothetical protein
MSDPKLLSQILFEPVHRARVGCWFSRRTDRMQYDESR